MGTPYLSEIRAFSFNFAPRGWALCNGQLLPINQNQALFSLLGTTYGGDGRTTFALPNLQGRMPMHMGNGHIEGEAAGNENVTLLLSQLPQHGHTITASSQATKATNANTLPTGKYLAKGVASVSGAEVPVPIYGTGSPASVLSDTSTGIYGGSQPHPNQHPYLVLCYGIALQGVFPSRN